MKPFLKWAGGKSRLAETIGRLLPERDGRLIEPFAGSGAVFMGVERKGYVLGDWNRDLVELYARLGQETPEAEKFVGRVESYFNAENNTVEGYLQRRADFNALAIGEPERCALFVYLNRHCFNGLCRYNASGGYNVPFGRPKAPQAPVREMMAFHRRARATGARFVHGDFMAVLEAVKPVPGDVVYMDPPYVPLSATASFDAYATGGFSAVQQQQVAEVARRLAGQGVPVLVSNHATDATRELYGIRCDDRGDLVDGVTVVMAEIGVRRSISANGGKRGDAPELLALFAREEDVTPRSRAMFAELAEAAAAARQGDMFQADVAATTTHPAVAEPLPLAA